MDNVAKMSMDEKSTVIMAITRKGMERDVDAAVTDTTDGESSERKKK